MPEIVFTDEEHDEIEALIAKHAPDTNERIAKALAHVAPATAARIEGEYLKTLHKVAELALTMHHVRNEIPSIKGGEEERGFHNYVHDALLYVDTFTVREEIKEIMEALWGNGDDSITQEFWSLCPALLTDAFPEPEKELADA